MQAMTGDRNEVYPGLSYDHLFVSMSHQSKNRTTQPSHQVRKLSSDTVLHRGRPENGNRQLCPCPGCNFAWTCSPQCQAAFKPVHDDSWHCDALYDIFVTSRLRIDYGLQNEQRNSLPLLYNPKRRSRYIPVSSCADWQDFKREFREGYAWGFIVDALLKTITTQLTTKAAARRALDLIVTESNMFLINILTALELAVPDLATRTELCIHVVEALDSEVPPTLNTPPYQTHTVSNCIARSSAVAA